MQAVRRRAVRVSGCAFVVLLASCSQGVPPSSGAGASASLTSAPPANAGAKISDAELAKMTRHELAQYIFEHNNCDSCHTLGAQGQLGYTVHGRQVRQSAEGCLDLLGAVKAISQKPQGQWTEAERVKYEHFGEYGCTACHKIRNDQLRPTALGEKLGNMHMSCPAVMHLLSEGEQQTTP